MQFFFNTLIGRQKMAQKKGSGYLNRKRKLEQQLRNKRFY
jgi:hypothetical protein